MTNSSLTYDTYLARRRSSYRPVV